MTLLWQTAATGSPYGFFFNNMHRNTYVPSGEDAVNTGNFAHFQDTTATRLLDQWKANAQRGGPEEDRDAAADALAAEAAGDPAVHRAAVVDLQHEVLPLLPDAAEPLRAADLQHLPRELGAAHDDLSGRQEDEDPASGNPPPAGGRPWPTRRPPGNTRDTRDAISPSSPRLLRDCPLGSDHAELPAAAADARRADRRDARRGSRPPSSRPTRTAIQNLRDSLGFQKEPLLQGVHHVPGAAPHGDFGISTSNFPSPGDAR